MADRRLKVGVAGLGIAGGRHVDSLARAANCELVAAADVRPNALKAFEAEYGGKGYESVAEMCEKSGVEAIWIASPNHLHAEHVLTAAERGVASVVEKPMAVTMDEATKMVEASEKHGTKLLSGHSSAMSPPFRAMRRIIDSGELGRLCAINVWSFTDWMLRPRMEQEVDLKRGGGLIYRQGPHQVDPIRLLGGGMIRSVRANVGQWLPERPAPGYYSAFLEFEDGTPATMTHNGYGYFLGSELVPWGVDRPRTSYEHRMRFRDGLRAGTLDESGAKEELRFGGQQTADQAAVASDHEREQIREGAGRNSDWVPADPGTFIVSCERGDIRQSRQGLFIYDDDGLRDVPNNAPGVTYHNAIDEMYDAVINGRPLYHDGRWGLATLEVCLAIMESAKQRKEIMLTHQSPTHDPANLVAAN